MEHGADIRVRSKVVQVKPIIDEAKMELGEATMEATEENGKVYFPGVRGWKIHVKRDHVPARVSTISALGRCSTREDYTDADEYNEYELNKKLFEEMELEAKPYPEWEEVDKEKEETEEDEGYVLECKFVVNCGGMEAGSLDTLRRKALADPAYRQLVDGQTSETSGADEIGGSCSGSGFKEDTTVSPVKGQFLVFDWIINEVLHPVTFQRLYPWDQEEARRSRLEIPSEEWGGPQMRKGVVLHHIIQPIPTEKTKGVLVWQSVFGEVVCGPTAEPVSLPCNPIHTLKAELMLLHHTAKVIHSGLVSVGMYCGFRTQGPIRDYIINLYQSQGWITVAGIRSTGLSASSGIGEYVVDLHDIAMGKRRTPHAPLGGYSQKGFAEKQLVDSVVVGHCEEDGEEEGAALPLGADGLPGVTLCARSPIPVPAHVKQLPRVPSLPELATDYMEHGDGCLQLWEERVRVTHPLTIYGLRGLGLGYGIPVNAGEDDEDEDKNEDEDGDKVHTGSENSGK